MNESNMDIKSQLREAQRETVAAQATIKQTQARTRKIAVWSAIGGFMLFAIGGQWFPGYQLDSTAKEASQEAAVGAVRNIMSQLCAERFMTEA